MDTQTKFWIILSFVLGFLVLGFTLYIGSQENIITDNKPREVPIVVDVDEEITNSPSVTEYISANQEILNKIEAKDKEGAEVAYRVTLIGDWSQVHNPDFYPEGAHFSPFIAWSYYRNINDLVFEVGGEATDGMEIMAETGNPKPLVKELEVFKEKNVVHDYKVGKIFHSPGRSSIIMHVNEVYSKVSFVSMIAPTPDWFVSVQKVDLYQNGWVEDLTLDTEVFDAGTDSGEEFNSPDRDTSPKERIQILEDGPNIPVARVRFQRVK